MKKKYSAEEIERKKSYIVQRAFESIPGRIIIDDVLYVMGALVVGLVFVTLFPQISLWMPGALL